MIMSFYYNNVKHYFESAGKNLPKLWRDVRSWPKEKIISLLIEIEKNRRKAWSGFFTVRNILADDRKDMLNMYYLFKNTEQRIKKNLRVDSRFILNILEKIGLRALSEEDEYGCCVCNKDMKDIELVSLINKCGHCVHTDCLNNRLNKDDKKSKSTCPICKVKYDKYDIYSIYGEQRNKDSIFQRISHYFFR